MKKVGVEVKEIYLKCTASFVTYQKQYSKKGKILENQALAIGQMNSALKEMVQVLECKTNDKSHGLEKISVRALMGWPKANMQYVETRIYSLDEKL